MNVNSNSSNEPPRSTGSGIGGRAWGLWQVVHGLGESFRGATMGAVDSMTSSDSSKNDAIANEGRAEIQRGWANLSGQPPAYEAQSNERVGSMSSPPWDPSAVPNEQSNMFSAGNYDRDPNVVQTNTGGMGNGVQASQPKPPALPPRKRSQGYGTMG